MDMEASRISQAEDTLKIFWCRARLINLNDVYVVLMVL